MALGPLEKDRQERSFRLSVPHQLTPITRSIVASSRSFTRRNGLDDRGEVDEAVDAAEPGGNLARERRDGRAVRDVDDVGREPVAGSRQSGRLLEPGRADVDGRDPGAAAERLERDRPADAVARAA